MQQQQSTHATLKTTFESNEATLSAHVQTTQDHLGQKTILNTHSDPAMKYSHLAFVLSCLVASFLTALIVYNLFIVEKMKASQRLLMCVVACATEALVMLLTLTVLSFLRSLQAHSAAFQFCYFHQMGKTNIAICNIYRNHMFYLFLKCDPKQLMFADCISRHWYISNCAGAAMMHHGCQFHGLRSACYDVPVHIYFHLPCCWGFVCSCFWLDCSSILTAKSCWGNLPREDERSHGHGLDDHVSTCKGPICNLWFPTSWEPEARRLVPGGVCWIAIPCSSWIFMFQSQVQYFRKVSN